MQAHLRKDLLTAWSRRGMNLTPETVERLQQAVWGQCRPVRTIQTPVYEYAALP